MSGNRRASVEPVVPRLLGLFDDEYDSDGRNVGWRLVGWAVVLEDGTTVTVSVSGPASVTLWSSLDAAQTGLDAYVDDVRPRYRLEVAG